MDILDEFDSRKSVYEDLSLKLNRLLKELLASAGIRTHSITTRLKDRESIQRKVDRNPGKYGDLSQVTDLCGARLITYFADEVEHLASLVETEFEIDRVNSVDKRQTQEPDRFGYLSVHYIAELKDTRTSLPEYRRFKGVKFEVQVRSILQHTWAEIEHDLQYKNVEAIPRELRRRSRDLRAY